METLLKYAYNHKQKIVYEKFRGEISLDEIIKHGKKKQNDPEHNDSYSNIFDITDSKFNFTNEEREIFYDLVKEVVANLDNQTNKNRRCAFITKTPKEVVTSVLFNISVEKFSPIKIKTFSTFQAACQWLKIDEINCDEFLKI